MGGFRKVYWVESSFSRKKTQLQHGPVFLKLLCTSIDSLSYPLRLISLSSSFSASTFLKWKLIEFMYSHSVACGDGDWC